jgi:hypothetical protein
LSDHDLKRSAQRFGAAQRVVALSTSCLVIALCGIPPYWAERSFILSDHHAELGLEAARSVGPRARKDDGDRSLANALRERPKEVVDGHLLCRLRHGDGDRRVLRSR